MTALAVDTSPKALARIGGALYLIIIFVGLFAEMFVRDKLIVSGNPGATAENIRAFEFLWRAGIAGNLFHLVCGTILALIFYLLLRPAGRDLALLAVFFDLISIGLEAAGKLHLVATLFPLQGAEYLQAFTPEQLHALAYLSIKSHSQTFGISLIFFGCACIVLGVLIFRSGYLPRIIGVLMQVAGLSYLLNSFALLLAPAIADLLFPAILIPPFLGETAFCLWLLIKGVDMEKWKTRTEARITRDASAKG